MTRGGVPADFKSFFMTIAQFVLLRCLRLGKPVL